MLLSLLLLLPGRESIRAANTPSTSRPISSVLRDPLPSEELSFSENAAEYVVAGPTFTYRVMKTTGAISSLRVLRDGEEVIAASGPIEIRLDQYELGSGPGSTRFSVVSQGKDKVVLQAQGTLRDPQKAEPMLDYTLLHTFFNDGVAVSIVKLLPHSDIAIRDALVYRLPAKGRFSHYFHKVRDKHGADVAVDGEATSAPERTRKGRGQEDSFSQRGALPGPGQTVRFSSLTSCLEAFSPAAALAIFTDAGAAHLSREGLDSASAEVLGKAGASTELSLAQYLVHVTPGDQPFILKAGQDFSFRVGISVAPNKMSHPRTHDVRMFTWVGDQHHPYPTKDEIIEIAKLGFTILQLHRSGTLGEPRPPAGEFERVLNKAHELGMLLLLEENADLMYTQAPGVQRMKTQGKWALWEGFNYGGRYIAKMDPFFDTSSTCLACPNGLAEYRLANIRRMMERFEVDGLFLDDNLGYPCRLQQEHGHPQPVYDCLFELHEMNWRRRQLMRSFCPHLLLISHCTTAFVLPVICDFDAQLYGEGYSFGTLENYWNNFVAWTQALRNQGILYAGDTEKERCAASIAYNYDLLTGGGQYNSIDWRLYPGKFPYAAGVNEHESFYIKTYNLAQYYFGLYESQPHYFAQSADLFSTTTPLSYATIYQNQTWGDWLIPVANMAPHPGKTSLQIHSSRALGIAPEEDYVLFDVQCRTAKPLRGSALNHALEAIEVPGDGLRLFLLRKDPPHAPYHLWGGKRIAEIWEATSRKLMLAVHGPAGLQETLFVGGAKHGIRLVTVAGQKAPFAYDPAQGLAYGQVTFGTQPLKVEVFCSPDGANALPAKPFAAVSVGPKSANEN